MKTLLLNLLCCVAAYGAEDIGPLELRPQATSGSQGILLEDLVNARPEQALPHLVLAPPPQIGRPVVVNRTQLNDIITRKAPELVCSNWLGADRVKITRATRVLTQSVLSELLTRAMQSDVVKDLGELELRFTRPWNSIVLPDELLAVKILELPNSGVSPNFICRFELIAGGETVGSYQQALQAKIWKEVVVAHGNLLRGQLVREADLSFEKRDILLNREYLTSVPTDDPFLELRDNVQAGTLLNSRVFRLRTILKRGRQVDAMFQDPSVTISVRAEALEDGVPGQIVRVRNIQSRKEFKGKVQDEQTIVVLF